MYNKKRNALEPLVIVNGQSSHLVYPNMHIHVTQACNIWSSIGRRSCKRIIEENITLVAQVVCFQILEFETFNISAFK